MASSASHHRGPKRGLRTAARLHCPSRRWGTTWVLRAQRQRERRPQRPLAQSGPAAARPARCRTRGRNAVPGPPVAAPRA
eukprot:2114042-Lingulodinium_polyedra.AAC.1